MLGNLNIFKKFNIISRDKWDGLINHLNNKSYKAEFIVTAMLNINVLHNFLISL